MFEFIDKRKRIINLIFKLNKLEELYTPEDVLDIEKRNQNYTKFLLIYDIITTTFYALIPLTYIKECEEKMKNAVYSKHIPCGVFTPAWFPFDYTSYPIKFIVQFLLWYTSTVFALVITACVFLATTIIGHIIGHIKNFKMLFITAINERKIEEFGRIIEYHVRIIK